MFKDVATPRGVGMKDEIRRLKKLLLVYSKQTPMSLEAKTGLFLCSPNRDWNQREMVRVFATATHLAGHAFSSGRVIPRRAHRGRG